MGIEAGHSSPSRFRIGSKAVFSLKNIRSRSRDAIRGLFIWFTSLMVTAIIVAISFQWLDRPIALLAHRGPSASNDGLWAWLTHIPNPLIPLALIAFVVLGVRALLGRPLSNHQAVAFICSLSVIITETAKDQLKFLFGRTWPETWTGNNPSFIRDGVYGFNFLHGGGGYQSFPSGHMGAACAVLSVLWICYPQLKLLWLFGGLAVGAALVGGNYHFLSDVIAGAFLGISGGWLVWSIWKMSGLGPSPKRNG
jgi:membrane-associated phospholipid phosphatase